MLNWQFILDVDPDGSGGFEIEEMIGFTDAEFSLARDTRFHGVSILFSQQDFTFQGDAADFLTERKKAHGVDADVRLLIRASCDDLVEYEEIFKLDFAQYSEVCGDECFVSIGIEQTSCFEKFKSRFDQKIDLDKAVSYDGSALTAYPMLNTILTLPSKTLIKSIEGNVVDEGDEWVIPLTGNGTINFFIRPTYANKKYEAIDTGALEPSCPYTDDISDDSACPVVTPILLYEDDPRCFDGTFHYNFRIKGMFKIRDMFQQSTVATAVLQVIRAHGNYNLGSSNPVVLHQTIIIPPGENPVVPNESLGTFLTRAFDYPWNGTVDDLVEGDGIYVVLGMAIVSGGHLEPEVTVEFDKETYVNIYGESRCPPTWSHVYMIHELLSRMTESMTDKCLKVYSEYYGRTDSLPTAYDNDGCGALRVLTSGLKIRNAPLQTFFLSMKEAIEGLQAIDNIGFALDKNPDTGEDELRIEHADHFYQDIEIIRFDKIARVEAKTVPGELYNIVNIGYEKWQAEEINSLDEFNSTREYRPSMTNVSGTRDLICRFIAAGYVIEVTRIQNFAKTGGADTKYDNETFIICLRRTDGSYEVDQGNILSPANIIDPATIYNWRIRPVTMLMRHFKSLGGIFPDYTTGKMLFNAGTGNILATGEQASLDCKIEAGVTVENQDVDSGDFAVPQDARPMFRPELVTFDQPLSLAEFNLLRTNPYGYISFRCKPGQPYRKGYLFSMKYRMTEGAASFELREKY